MEMRVFLDGGEERFVFLDGRERFFFEMEVRTHVGSGHERTASS